MTKAVNGIMAVLCCALVPTGAAADPQSPAPASVPPKRVTDPNRKICRTEVSTYSRLDRKRVCKTASEWAEEEAATRSDVGRNQRARLSGS